MNTVEQFLEKIRPALDEANKVAKIVVPITTRIVSAVAAIPIIGPDAVLALSGVNALATLLAALDSAIDQLAPTSTTPLENAVISSAVAGAVAK